MSSLEHKPAVGSLLNAEVGSDRMPLAAMARIDPTKAALRALQVYLENGAFLVPGTPDRCFRLNQVRTNWPESFEGLDYPTAALTIATQGDGPQLTPFALEDTADCYGPGTVLWKTGELEMSVQMDAWCTNVPERDAIAAALPEMFSPTEVRRGVVLQGPPDYWDRPVRVSLDPTRGYDRQDNSDSVFRRERELRAWFDVSLDIVQLRRVPRLTPEILVNGEPVATG